jgi:RNA-directed DNA polymerase
VFARYFAKFNKARQDRWVFGDRHSGAYMHRFAWTSIVRHQLVRSGASPDDPALGDYWAWRRRKAPLPINHTSLRLLKAQNGRCAICKSTLLAVDDRPQTPHQWEQWLGSTRRTIMIVTQALGTPDTRPGRAVAVWIRGVDGRTSAPR